MSGTYNGTRTWTAFQNEEEFMRRKQELLESGLYPVAEGISEEDAIQISRTNLGRYKTPILLEASRFHGDKNNFIEFRASTIRDAMIHEV